MTLEAKSLTKAVVPSTLIPNPSPGNLQSTRLALHVSEDGSSCWAYVASGCHIYKLKIPLEDSFVSKGKESLLIPVLSQVMDSFLVTRCPHRSEIQSIVLAETESTGYLMLGSVDSYGHLIVSKLDPAGEVRLTLILSVLQITGLAFSSIDPDHIYIQGVDYEVLCGQWKENTKVFSFRGDSNWLGFTKVLRTSVFNMLERMYMDVCKGGRLYIAVTYSLTVTVSTQSSLDNLVEASMSICKDN
ncbi:hypothetical protein CJ030_MR0G007485 [Morella rubra]|uniref:Uncharacterized protein n=1 Tax=Morella rubra TaxID=262757 RepID=A0A6A1UJ01_9ROSI|nr:hypothetical protein CJ030_MR0G007485 [Morella rubra]